MKKNVIKKMKRRQFSEKKRVEILLGDFDASKSRGLELIKYITQNNVSRFAMISVATLASILIKVPLKRDYQRKKELIIMWFDENYEKLEKIKDKFCIDYEVRGQHKQVRGKNYVDFPAPEENNNNVT